MSGYDPETEALIAIVERGMETALRQTAGGLLHRLTHTEDAQAAHRAAGRKTEAAACAIRAQALREAIAELRGNALGPLRATVRGGIYRAETP